MAFKVRGVTKIEIIKFDIDDYINKQPDPDESVIISEKEKKKMPASPQKGERPKSILQDLENSSETQIKFPGNKIENLRVKLSQDCKRCLIVNGNDQFIFDCKSEEGKSPKAKRIAQI